MFGRQADPLLTVPALPPVHVSRPRLLAALDNAANMPLTLLSAGPGAGKTVLLSDWVTSRTATAAWLTVTPADAAPRRFWRLLRAALRRNGEPGGDAPRRCDSTDAILSLLGGEHGSPAPSVLVIDDAQLLTHPDVLNALDMIIRSWPSPPLRLILASRTDPPLPLHRYRLAGQLCELRGEDLAMTRSEAHELLLAHDVTLPGSDLDALMARTEGWVAGVRLSAMRMEGSAYPARSVSELALGQGSIGEYLLAEVLDRQPETVRRMLVETSLFDEVTGPLAEAVTGIAGCSQMLAGLARINSFVLPLDAAQTRFRCHRLFAELLRHELQQQARHSMPGLMRRAAVHFAGIGDVRGALVWAAAAADWPLAASVLVHGGLAHAFVHRQDLSGSALARLRQQPSTAGANAAHGPNAAAAASAVAAVMADGETAAAELLGNGHAAVERPADRDLLVTTVLARLILGMKAGDAHVVDTAAATLVAQASDAPGYRVAGLSAAALLAQASSHFWHGKNEDVDALLRTALTEAERTGPAVVELDVLAMTALVDSLLSRPRHAQDAELRARAMLHKHTELSCPPALEIAEAGRLLIAADLAGAGQALQRVIIPDAVGIDPGLAVAHEVGKATWLLSCGAISEARAVLLDAPSCTTLPLLRLLSDTLVADVETALGRPNAALMLLHAYRDGDLAILTALPRARAFLALGDWRRAKDCARAVMREASPLVSRYTLTEAMLCDAQIAQQKGDTERALEMIMAAIELAQDGIVLPFLAARRGFGALLDRHPAVAARWPLPPEGEPLHAGNNGGGTVVTSLPDPLTEREHAVLRLLATSLSTAEIADEMCLSINTVKTHLAAIYRKLTASRRREAVLRARQLELL